MSDPYAWHDVGEMIDGPTLERVGERGWRITMPVPAPPLVGATVYDWRNDSAIRELAAPLLGKARRSWWRRLWPW